MTRRYTQQDTLRVERRVNTDSEAMHDFTDLFGYALRGKGITHSLGSMALGELTGNQFHRVRIRMAKEERAKIDLADLEKAMQERLNKRPQGTPIEIEGLGLYGTQVRRGRQFGTAKIAFVIADDNELVNEDEAAIREVLDEFHVPSPNFANFDRHITFGDVYLERILKGQSENPHLLVPKGLIIPCEVALDGISADIVDRATNP